MASGLNSEIEADVDSSTTISSPTHTRRVGAIMLAVAALAMVATLPGRTFGLGLFTKAISKDFGVGDLSYGTVNCVATLIGALFCFPAGWSVDRFGVRPVLSVVGLCLALTMLVMSAVDGYWALLACITLTRGFGQGALTVTSVTLAGRAFGRKAAWPLAIYSVALTIGFIVVSVVVMEAMKTIDASTAPDAFRAWRGVWRMIGLAIVVSVVPAAWLLPKGIGRGSDRFEPLTDIDTAVGQPALDDSFTLREVLATPIFWVFAAATTSFGLAYAGLSLFNENVLNVRGFGKDEFQTMLGVMTALGLVGNGVCGFGAKYWSYCRLTSIAMVVYAAALVSLALIETKWQLMVASALLGVAGGMITVIFFAAWGRTFGQLHLGRIQGTTQMLSVVASAMGPILFALSFERTGSYQTVLFALAAVVVLIGLVAYFVRPPHRRAIPTDSSSPA